MIDEEAPYCTIYRKLIQSLKDQFPEWNRNRLEHETLELMRIHDDYEPYYQEAVNAFGSTSRINYSGNWKDNYDHF